MIKVIREIVFIFAIEIYLGSIVFANFNVFDYQAYHLIAGADSELGDNPQALCNNYIANVRQPLVGPLGYSTVNVRLEQSTRPDLIYCRYDTDQNDGPPSPDHTDGNVNINAVCQDENPGTRPEPIDSRQSPIKNANFECACNVPFAFNTSIQWCVDSFTCPSGGTATIVNGIWICDQLPVAEKEAGPTCPSPYDSSNDNTPNPATGNTYTKTTDFSGSRRSNSFTRHKNNSSGLANSPLGHGWSANGFQTLGVDGTNIIVMQATGRSEPATCSGVGACTLDADSRILLEQTTSGYQVTTASNNVQVYDSVGKLLTITEPSGQVTTMSHNSNGLIETMTDHFGSVMSFTYNVGNQVATMTDSDSNVYTYAYDANDNLTSVTNPDTTVKQYLYEDTNFPNHITGIIDERSIRTHTWGYDTQGRALYFEKAGGAERVDYTYNIDGTTTITDSLGATNTFTFAESHGVKRTTAISGGQCATGCAQGQAQSYDANGFLSSRTDFEGNITNYTNNSRGLEISRTEAVGTSEARAITTEWHATFRLPTKITEPGKETTFTYDTNGKLLTRNEKAL